jgi:pimeloyl-ACP methyl ester carboxylesterase
MEAVLAAAAPADAALKAAHAAFAPLRAYLAAKDLPTDNVLTASVFTVGEVRAPMAEVAAAVAASDAPVASDWVKCGGAAVSPCVQAEDDRACGDDVEGYDEYHALLAIPVYQQGTAPYLTPADGGGLDISKPHTEEVCMSLTVPEGAAPAAGWPTVVFAHGTGGSFRSQVRPEVAGVLAAATPKFAVIGIDQVEHGPRRGDSTESPNNLFFNFLNPAVTRGNPLQGAADQLSVARFAKALNIDAGTSGGSAIKLDPAKLYFFGHSQGSTEGSLMLPYGDDYKAAVLSGNGASLRDALRTKTQPQNIAAALPLVLQDPTMQDSNLGPGVTQYHPVLSLLQQWIDPADPLNFAAVIGSPLQGHSGKHLFQTFGVEDSYSPPLTMATFALAAGVKQVDAHTSADPLFDQFDDQLVPVAVGYKAPGSGITLGMRQYGAPDSDGHFVVFDTQAANDDMVLFLTGAAGLTPPVIGQ